MVERLWLKIAVLAAMLAVSVAAPALEPARGRMLVASPALRDPNFHKTVILLLDYSDQGAIGLIVNRPGRLPASEVLPEFEELGSYRGRLYFGGPVALHAMLLLLRGADEDWDTDNVIGDVHVSADPEVLHEAAGHLDDKSLRIYAGYAGWAPGQLDHEIAAGSWHVINAHDEHVFTTQPEKLWKQLSPLTEPLQVRSTPNRDQGSGYRNVAHSHKHRGLARRIILAYRH